MSCRGCWTTRRERARLSARASVAVRAYDWPAVAQQVLRVYELALGGTGARVDRAEPADDAAEKSGPMTRLARRMRESS